MHHLLSVFAAYFFIVGCSGVASNPTGNNQAPVTETKAIKDTVPVAVPTLKPYTSLVYDKKEVLNAASGTKSVLFNTSGSKLYAMNLEGMSIYEFDQPTRKLVREFKFTPTKGTGWDYVKDKPIPSWQEKPVEACFSHNDEILWVSLHNADGVVPVWINDFSKNNATEHAKKITVNYPGTTKKDSFNVPLIETGKTPKVISKTADSKYLLVSNWHSYTTSVLSLNADVLPYGKVISNIKVPAIPRGVVVDDAKGISYITIMGGATLSVVDNNTWTSDSSIAVRRNPRHVLMDTTGRLYVSYNRSGMIACIDAASGKELFTSKTNAQPRTIVLSKNHKFIFVTCYNSDFVDVFKINEDNFEKVISLPCKGHPVGVDIFEDDDKLEAWVCSYSNGAINIYSFNKK